VTQLASMITARAGHGLVHVVDAVDRRSTTSTPWAASTARGRRWPPRSSRDRRDLRDRPGPGRELDRRDRVLSEPRHQLGVSAVDHFAAPRVPEGTTFVYALAGLSSALADDPLTVSTAEVALLGPDGELGPFVPLDGATRTAGFAHVAASNFLYIIGGGPTSPTAGSTSGEICGAGLSCTGDPADPPDVQNWNNTASASPRPGTCPAASSRAPSSSWWAAPMATPR